MANYQSRGYRDLKQFIAVPIPSQMIDFGVLHNRGLSRFLRNTEHGDDGVTHYTFYCPRVLLAVPFTHGSVIMARPCKNRIRGSALSHYCAGK